AVPFGLLQWLMLRRYGIRVTRLWPVLTVGGALLASLVALAMFAGALAAGARGAEAVTVLGGLELGGWGGGGGVGGVQQGGLGACVGRSAADWTGWSALGGGAASLGLAGMLPVSAWLDLRAPEVPLHLLPLLLPAMLYAAVTRFGLMRLPGGAVQR